MASPFDILGVDPDADDEEVTRAYRERVKEAHPDQGGSREEFRRVRAAYEAIQAGEREAPDEVDVDAETVESEPYDPDERLSEVEYLNFEVFSDHGWTLDDEDLFEKAAAADLDPADHGRFVVEPDESLLEAAERCGYAWPYACRGGACANCAVALVAGEMSLPGDHVLPPEQVDRGIRLSCNGAPTTPEAKVVFNVKYLPDLDDLRLPPGPFRTARADD